VSQIHVDPQALRDFAGALVRFREVVNEEGNKVDRQLARLGETWRDQEYDRFVDEFIVALRAIEAFSADLDVAVPLLLRDAEAIQTYQSYTRSR